MEDAQNEEIRKMDKLRFYADTVLKDTEAYQRAIAIAFLVANGELSPGIKKGGIKKIILLIPQRDSADSGMFNEVFSAAQVALVTKGGLKFDEHPLIKTEPYTTYKENAGNHNYPATEIIIGCGVSSDVLFDVEHYTSVAAIIGISWHAQQLAEWLKTWNPGELRKKLPAFTPYPEPSCVTKVAMKRLTDLLDSSKSIHTPRDEEHASIYFTTLHKYDVPLDPATIGAYLISKLNWPVTKAREAEAIIARLNNGHKPKGGKAEKSRYERWNEECKSKYPN